MVISTDPGVRCAGENAALGKNASRFLDVAEGKSRTLRNIEQAVLTVRQIEQPQTSHEFRTDPLRTDRRVEPPSPKLWLALRDEVQVPLVILQYVEDAEIQAEGVGETLRTNEIEVVCRGVVLGYSLCGVLVKDPTARSKPGEQYWRSS